jgi:hypothetical protein
MICELCYYPDDDYYERNEAEQEIICEIKESLIVIVW